MNQKEVNWLEIWRTRSGIQAQDVNAYFGFPKGRIEYYEAVRILRVPCCELVQIVKLYDVSQIEFLAVLIG